eukprot:COSAG01_NODE_524_length_15931_cov_72.340491_11_plen_165_part_00
MPCINCWGCAGSLCAGCCGASQPASRGQPSRESMELKQLQLPFEPRCSRGCEDGAADSFGSVTFEEVTASGVEKAVGSSTMLDALMGVTDMALDSDTAAAAEFAPEPAAAPPPADGSIDSSGRSGREPAWDGDGGVTAMALALAGDELLAPAVDDDTPSGEFAA